MKPVRRRARDDAVVVDEAVVTQQDSVARAADREVRPVVDVEPIQELGGIWADYGNFPECRSVKNSAGRSHGKAFARDGGAHVFAGPRKIARPLPQPDVFEHRIPRFRPFMHRRGAHRIEQVAPCHARKTAKCDGRVRHAKGGEPDLGNGLAEALGDNTQRVEIGRLALIGRHPDGGVALDVLDGAKAFTRGERQIIGGDVVLPVHEGLCTGACWRLR